MATALPQELFKHILWHLCDGDCPFINRETKISISLAGQVCRYWARLTRRRLFEWLVLRSAAEFQQLQSFLAMPTLSGLEPLAVLISSVDVIISGTGRPWLHLAVSAVQALPECELFAVVTNADTGDGLSPARPNMLHAGLPRSLPGPNIAQLRLYSLRFANGRMLFRLLASIPSLRTLDVCKVSFDTQPTSADFCAPPYGWLLSDIESDDLIAVLFLPLLVTSLGCRYPAPKGRREQTPKFSFDGDDYRTLMDLLSILEGS